MPSNPLDPQRLRQGLRPKLSACTRAAAAIVIGFAGMAMVASPAFGAEEEARVLILNGLDPYLPAYMAIDSAMRANLAKETNKRIVLYSEPLDAQRFSGESLEPEVLALLTKKYKSVKIDVVVTVLQPALAFYKRHGDALWPGASVVFHGIPELTVEPRTLPPNAVGLVNVDDFEGTIRLAQRLQPDARRILVIGGASPLDMELNRRARDLVPPLAGKAEVEFLVGAPLPDILTRVKAEPADTIIFYLSEFRDRDGRPYLPRDVLRAISNASAAPVYGLFETYVGAGVAAGNMEFYADRGQRVGELVRATLNGTTYPASQAVFTVPSRCVADARALQRWSLDESRLPSGCDVRFADRPLWRQYWWQLTLAFAILLAQSLLIAALLRQRRRRQVAEAESRRRFAEMVHLNRRVSMGELSASIAHELNQPLGAIHNNAGAAEMLIKAEPPRLQEVAEILADIKRDDQRASEIIARIRKMVRKGDFEVQSIDLNATIGETAKLVAADATVKGVSLKVEPAPGLLKVRADPVEVQQVILNLALNAIEAMYDQNVEFKGLGDSLQARKRERGRGVCDRFRRWHPCGASCPASSSRS